LKDCGKQYLGINMIPNKRDSSSDLEKIVRSYLVFDTAVKEQTFPMAYADAIKWFKQKYEPYQRQGLHPLYVANELLTYLHKMYGYTLQYDERKHPRVLGRNR